MLAAGVEKELVQDLKKWSSDTLVSLYNDNTTKDRKWKGLEKLKATLEKDGIKEVTDNTIENST